ncbi:MAG: hypothetical protein ACJ76L_03510 [Conexibacter sp.]
MDVATLAAVVMVALTVALGGAGISLSRRPDRWRSVFTERFWLRWVAWTIVLTAAGVAGSVAGGGTLVVPMVAIGLTSLVFAGAMWVNLGRFSGR